MGAATGIDKYGPTLSAQRKINEVLSPNSQAITERIRRLSYYKFVSIGCSKQIHLCFIISHFESRRLIGTASRSSSDVQQIAAFAGDQR